MEAVGLRPAAVMSLWHGHQAGRCEAHTILWAILILLQFYRGRP
jgi:hypothetical protein